MEKTLIVLLGPTGVGKTDLSIDLARHFGTSILSCDSRQMYREMRIGTAVPEKKQLNLIFLYIRCLCTTIIIPGNLSNRLWQKSMNYTGQGMSS
jgi:tRNA A37 N6-isopentenylltransferase MiaA